MGGNGNSAIPFCPEAGLGCFGSFILQPVSTLHSFASSRRPTRVCVCTSARCAAVSYRRSRHNDFIPRLTQLRAFRVFLTIMHFTTIKDLLQQINGLVLLKFFGRQCQFVHRQTATIYIISRSRCNDCCTVRLAIVDGNGLKKISVRRDSSNLHRT